MRIRKPTLRAQLASESNELLAACLDLKRPGSLYSSECQGLAVLADLCQTVLCERSKKQAAAEAQCLASNRVEPSKQVRSPKRKLHDAEAGETYKAQYEWGYVPIKRKRAASPASSCLQPATPLSSHHPTQSVDSTQLDFPCSAVNTQVQPRHLAIRPVSDATPQHQHEGFTSPLLAVPEHACRQLKGGPSSTVSPLPASSASDVTTLYCNEELIDTMDTIAGTPDLHQTHCQSRQGQLQSKPRAVPALFLPSSPAVKVAKVHPQQGLCNSISLSEDTPVSAREVTGGFGSTQQSSINPLQHQVSGGAMECAQILLGTWDAVADNGGNTPEPSGSPCKQLRAESVSPTEADVPRAKSVGGNGPQCGFCLTRDTPQWRDGPGGTRTACNACSTAWQRWVQS
ncbi:hypothetical protein WJX84_008310 [Apatococcus fuscideae]|uniref:GATA-type domain-containing protein n=1 Tax=Apatococcus fuscideae TaxID=2026836 RepID=A0AAW1SPZ8_9CHLO